MQEDPRRRFVYAFTIENTTMRVWLCDRSEVLVSEPFDFMRVSPRLAGDVRLYVSFYAMSQDHEKFAHFFLWFSC